MGKSKAVENLLVMALAIYAVDGNEILGKAIEALEAKEDVTHTSTEYKELKAIVDELDGDGEKDTKGTPSQKVEKKISMAGVKMIGSKYYHKNDGYKKSFGTAKECAKHFNK